MNGSVSPSRILSHHDYYASTAYSSAKPRELPPRAERDRLSRAGRSMRGKEQPLAWGIYFGDFRNLSRESNIRRLRTRSESSLLKEVSPETIVYPTMHNPKAAWAMLRGVAGLICIVVGAMEAVRLSSRGLTAVIESFLSDPSSLLIPGIPFGLFLLGAIAVPLSENKNNIVLNRRTGMVTLPKHVSGKEENVPFDEFDAYLQMRIDPKLASPFWRLHIGHRADSRGFDVNYDFRVPAEAFQNWEFLQQFMDVSKPLPDIALFEPVRQLDPVTAEHDRRTGRPPHYWRDIDLEEAYRDSDHVDTVMREFFWESLPRGNGPYDQDAWIEAWRSHYTDQAAVVDGLKRKGWWPGKGREAQVAPLSDPCCGRE